MEIRHAYDGWATWIGLSPPGKWLRYTQEVTDSMNDKKTGNPSAREDWVYAREDTLPVGSTGKSRAHAGEPDEQYPIPAARPIPWQENPSG